MTNINIEPRQDVNVEPRQSVSVGVGSRSTPVVNVEFMRGPAGPPGPAIVSMDFVNQELLVTLDNGTVINAGQIEGLGEGGGLTQEQAQNIALSILSDHQEDVTPHPAYDDLPSLKLIFENGLV